MEGTWDVVVHGLAVHQETQETRAVVIAWREGDSPAVTVAHGDRVMPEQWRRPGALATVTSFLFEEGCDGGDRSRPDAIPDPVSIDGSPRNRLRDRVARRGLEAMAAD